jgi:hypothetical protein
MRPRCGVPTNRTVAASTAVAIGHRGSATGLDAPGEPVSPTPVLVDSLMEMGALL